MSSSEQELYGVKIKTYDWMHDNEFALVKPGQVNVIKFPDGHEEIQAVLKPQIVIAKLNPKGESK